MPFITHVVKLNAGLVPSLLNSYSHCFLLYHTDNIPDYPLEWKGWESHIVQCCLKRRCPDYWVQLSRISGFPTKLHFPTWPPKILKLFITSHFSPESRERRRIFTGDPMDTSVLIFYDSLLMFRFLFHFYSPKYPYHLKP